MLRLRERMLARTFWKYVMAREAWRTKDPTNGPEGGGCQMVEEQEGKRKHTRLFKAWLRAGALSPLLLSHLSKQVTHMANLKVRV